MGFEPQTVPRRPTGEPGAAQFEYFYYRRGFSLGVSSLGSLQPRISLFLVFACYGTVRRGRPRVSIHCSTRPDACAPAGPGGVPTSRPASCRVPGAYRLARP
jgi:hypothetical protein